MPADIKSRRIRRSDDRTGYRSNMMCSKPLLAAHTTPLAPRPLSHHNPKFAEPSRLQPVSPSVGASESAPEHHSSWLAEQPAPKVRNSSQIAEPRSATVVVRLAALQKRFATRRSSSHLFAPQQSVRHLCHRLFRSRRRILSARGGGLWPR